MIFGVIRRHWFSVMPRGATLDVDKSSTTNFHALAVFTARGGEASLATGDFQ